MQRPDSMPVELESVSQEENQHSMEACMSRVLTEESYPERIDSSDEDAGCKAAVGSGWCSGP